MSANKFATGADMPLPVLGILGLPEHLTAFSIGVESKGLIEITCSYLVMQEAMAAAQEGLKPLFAKYRLARIEDGPGTANDAITGKSSASSSQAGNATDRFAASFDRLAEAIELCTKRLEPTGVISAPSEMIVGESPAFDDPTSAKLDELIAEQRKTNDLLAALCRAAKPSPSIISPDGVGRSVVGTTELAPTMPLTPLRKPEPGPP
jgi:hypothetical protein